MKTPGNRVLGRKVRGEEEGGGNIIKEEENIVKGILVSFEATSRHTNQDRRNKLSDVLKLDFCRSNREIDAEKSFS